MRRRKWVRGTAGVRIQWNDGTSHHPYKKRHVDGTDKTLSSSLSSSVDQGKVNVNVKVGTTPKATLA